MAKPSPSCATARAARDRPRAPGKEDAGDRLHRREFRALGVRLVAGQQVGIVYCGRRARKRYAISTWSGRAAARGGEISFLVRHECELDSMESRWRLRESGQRTETPQVVRGASQISSKRNFKPELRGKGRGANTSGNANVRPPVKRWKSISDDIRRARFDASDRAQRESAADQSGREMVSLFSVNVGGQTNLYLYPLGEGAAAGGRGGRGRCGGGEARTAAVDLDAGPEMARAFQCPIQTGFYWKAATSQGHRFDNRNQAVSVTAEMDVDFNTEKMTVFEKWAQRDGYHENFRSTTARIGTRGAEDARR